MRRVPPAPCRLLPPAATSPLMPGVKYSETLAGPFVLMLQGRWCAWHASDTARGAATTMSIAPGSLSAVFAPKRVKFRGSYITLFLRSTSVPTRLQGQRSLVR